MNKGITTLSAILCTAVVLLGCTNTESIPETTDPSAQLFDPTRIVEVEIEMSAEDWDSVRLETRDLDGFLSPTCLVEPFSSTFTYKSATVSVDGKVFNNVGVRKKGFVGSIDSRKPSLKIKLDRFVEGQELFGYERLTLNNNKSDPSHIVQCLTFSLFARAGLPAPKCNFAQVTVNGNNLGLYSNIESIKKRFLARAFADNTGRLYEGTLSDFNDAFIAMFEAKTDKDNTDRSDLLAVQTALAVADDKLEAAVGAVVDIERFIKFWAMEMLVGHGDGYTGNRNNFFTYFDPQTGMAVFVPWGVDMTLNGGGKFGKSEIFAKGLLARRLYALPATKQRFLDTLKELGETTWNVPEILEQIDAMEQLIATIAATDSLHTQGDLATEIESVREHVRGVPSLIEASTANPPTMSDASDTKPCYTPVATTEVSFSTTLTSTQSDNPVEVGGGTMSGTLGSGLLTPGEVGIEITRSSASAKSSAGLLTKIVARLDQARLLVAEFEVALDGDTVPGTTNLGWTAGRKNQGSLSVLNTEANDTQLLGAIWSGTLVLDEASLTEGEPIKGTFSAKWYEVEDTGGKDKDPASCKDGETQKKGDVTYFCQEGKWVAKK